MGLLAVLVAATGLLHASTPLTTISYTIPDSTYVQNFDAFVSANTMNDATSTLSASGPNNVQDLVAAPISAPASLNGWSIANTATPTRPRFLIENGSRSILPGGNYAFYTSGTGLNPDMALGTCAYAGGNMVADTTPRMGAIFVNNTGVTLKNFAIQFRMEQWYSGQVTHAHNVTFEYSVGATDINTVGSGSPFIAVSALNLVSLKFGQSTKLDGNANGNFTTKSAVVSATWPPGAQLVIRWTDLNEGNPGPDKLAVDDFQFIASQATTYYVTDMTPPPNSIQTSAVPSVVLTFVSNLSTTSVNANTLTLQSGGADGILDTADDVFLAPTISVVNGNQIKLDLPAQGRVTQLYRVRVIASPTAPPNSAAYIQGFYGNNLDGEFGGTFPSGDGSDGGDFVASFEVDLLPTTLVTSVLPATINYGTAGSITLTATASASQNVDMGTITFQLKKGGVNFGSPLTSATVVNGAGSVNYPIPAGSSAGNYNVMATYSGGGAFFGGTDSTAQVFVMPAPLSIVASDATRVYGAADPLFSGTISGIKNSDVITATYASNALTASPIGHYSIVPTLSDPGGKLSNYTLTTTNGTYTITVAPLTASAANTSRVYGKTNPVLTGTLFGVQAGDVISATYTTAANPSSPLGLYAIQPLISDPGNKLGNYTVTMNNGILTVSPASLVVLVANATRPYGAPNPVFSGTLFGTFSGDAISATYTSNATSASPAGQYPIVPALLDPSNKLGNYTINYFNGTLTISKAALSVSIHNVSRPYGAANPELTGTIAGIQNNDAISATYATNADSGSVIGTFAIVPTLVDSGGKLGNYQVSAPNGTLTITKAALRVDPADVSATYGDPIPPLVVSIVGVQNGDNITTTVSTAATTGSAVGSYLISALISDPDGKLPNYDVTIKNSFVTINPAILSVMTVDANRVYGAPDPVFTGTFSGVIDGDNLTATYSPGTPVASPAGTYPILAIFSDPSGKLGNYSLSANYGTFTILKSTPLIAWPPPSRIIAGTPLDDAQLNASASDPISSAELKGTFAYTPAVGTVLSPGVGQTLSVLFTPNDAANYTSQSASTTLDVDPAIPVTITSATTASVTQSVPFFYIITATGSAPMTFNADGLPAGLLLTGSVISGSPTVTGVFDVVLTVSNYAGSASQPLKLVVTQAAGTNHAPVFNSPPKASANPATSGVALTLTVSATDVDGDALDYTWDFGDGTTGIGASVSKTFAAAGAYVVKVVVSDGQATDLQSIVIVVNDQLTVGTFTVTKVKLMFNFTKSGSDSLSVSGTIPLPAAFNPAGKTIRVLIGELDKTYTLNAKGDSPDKAFKFKGKLNSASAAFTYLLKKQSLFPMLENLGFSKTLSNPALDFPVVIVLDGASSFAHPAINYTVKSSKNGTTSGIGKK